MARYQVLIEYVGTSFRGWQIQKKGSTIQGLIQQHLSKLLKEKINSKWVWQNGCRCTRSCSVSPLRLSKKNFRFNKIFKIN